MNLTKFLKKYVFKIMSIVLIVCSCDQFYMLMKYRNITTETFVVTLFLTGLCIYFGFGKFREKDQEVFEMQELMKLLGIDLNRPMGYVKIAVASLILGFVVSMMKDLL